MRSLRSPATHYTRWLLLIVLALVAYGSLFPFRFSANDSAARWQQFLTVTRLFTSRGDVIGNIALFLPYGMLAGFAAGRTRAPKQILLLAACGVAWALVLQIGQIYLAPRDPALSDVVWNSFGIVIGLGLARLGTRLQGVNLRGSMHSAIIAALAFLWSSIELLPFVPTLDWQSIKDHLKPLMLTPEITPARFAEHFAGALIAGRLISEVGWRPLWLVLAMMLLGMSFAKLFMIGRELSTSMAAGFAAAWCAWLVLGRMKRGHADVFVGCALLAAYSLNALRPFVFTETAGQFNWRPFYGHLQGSMLANVGSSLTNLFYYLGVLALVREHTQRWLIAAAVLLLWAFALEQAQTRLPGRYADITELVWVLLVAVGLMLLPRYARAAPS